MNILTFIKNTFGFKTKKYTGIFSNGLPKAGKNINKNDYLTAYEISLYVNKAIEIRANKVSEIEFVLQNDKKENIKQDNLINLLYKPNKIFTARQFWGLYQKYYDLFGEVYILLETQREIFKPTQINQMHLLNPTSVTPFFDKTGNIVKYEYNTTNEIIEYTPEQIIYIHNPNPRNPLRGVSLLQAGMTTINSEIKIEGYNNNIIENNGKVDGVFKFSTGPLTRDQLEKIKDDYKKEYKESVETGIPLFLGGGADYIKIGLNPTEIGYLEIKKSTLEDICILTGVPKTILASTDDVKYDNADTARSIFLKETIVPLLTVLTTALDEKFFPVGKNLTFVDPTPENIEEKRKNIEIANTIGAITVNEKRALLKELGIQLNPVEDGNDILVSFGLVPLGEDRDINEPETRPSEEKRIKKHPLKDKNIRDLYAKIQVKKINNRQKPFEKQLKNYFKEQEIRLLEKITPQKLKHFKKSQVDELLSLDLEVKIGKEKFLPILESLLKQAGIDAMEMAGSGYRFNMTDSIITYINNRADFFLKSINDTTFTKLRKVFTENATEGGTREQLVKKIQNTYGEITKFRAGLIARTETHNQTQYGTMQGYKQSGLNTKIWVSVVDGETRDSHLMTDGEERPLDRPFSNGLMYPGDPSGDAEEVINCRCVI